jgi:hypothetical protein
VPNKERLNIFLSMAIYHQQTKLLLSRVIWLMNIHERNASESTQTRRVPIDRLKSILLSRAWEVISDPDFSGS